MSAILKDPLLTLRAMSRDDLPRLMVLENRNYEFPWTEGVFADCFRVGYCCWGFEREDELVGYAVMSSAAGEAHILNITIHKSYRGQGLAKRLMQRMQTLASEQGADMLFLEVRATNTAAVNLYGALGFNEIGYRRGYYPAAKGREDAILFARAIPQ